MAGRLDERYGRVIMAKDKETYDSYAQRRVRQSSGRSGGRASGRAVGRSAHDAFPDRAACGGPGGRRHMGCAVGSFSDVLFGNNGTSQAADDKASDSGDSKTGDTTKSGTSEQSTSSSTDGSSDTASNTSTGFRPERYDIEQQRRFDRCHRHERAGGGLHRLVRRAVDARRPPPRRTRPLPSA